MALLLQSGESGFAIVIAVTLGIIMVVVGLTMTIRSQGDQILASNQKETEQALAAAEKGIAFYQNFFNRGGANRRLSQYSDCINRSNGNPGAACNDPGTTSNITQMSWSNAQNIEGLTSACNATALNDIRNIYASTNWKDVDDPLNTDPNFQPGSKQFRLVSYRYRRGELVTQPGIGRLIIEGRITPNGNNNANKSIARLEVSIPIRPGDINSVPIPGVWVGATSNSEDDDGTQSNRIEGDILINNCNVSTTNMTTMQNSIIGNHKVKKTDLTMPSIPPQPQERIIGSPPENPPTDPFDWNAHYPGTIPLGNVSGDITLPDNTEDFTDPSNPKPKDEHFTMPYANVQDAYYYTIDSIANNTTIRIKPNTKVVFYFSGSITRNVNIICETDGMCDPMSLTIFGTATTGNPEICINGNRRIEAFILAPEYNVGVNGGGNAINYKGAVWSKTWGEGNGCSSNAGGNHTHVQQEGTWDDMSALMIEQLQQPPIISPTGAWTRQEVN